jgi:glutamate-ammonia-ligase adenylyltransferase
LLLDELLDPRRLYDPCKPEELDNALQAQLAHLPLDDLEMLMDSLRQFKRAHVLHVAAAEISAHLKVERTSDYLTAIADTLVGRTLAIAWEHLSQKHGVPMCRVADELQTAGFCVVAYGKAGSIELTYSSDLDLVFLHDSHGESQFTEGAKPLDNSVFFARLAQRIIHILTANMSGGILYEVDQRLRPSGASGLLVSSLEAFKLYQFQDAWTWEHQALVRARVIAGDARCKAKFQQIRHDILTQPRDIEKLRLDVIEMRGKMRDSLDKSTATAFDIKQGEGGLADVEFIMQYQVLRWAASFPKLLENTAVLPTLNCLLESELIPTAAHQQLSHAYHCYRVEIHRLVLQNQPTQVPQQQLWECREAVLHWWEQMLVKQRAET